MAEYEFEVDETIAFTAMAESNKDVEDTRRKRTLSARTSNEPSVKKDIEVDFDYTATTLTTDDEIQRDSFYDLKEEIEDDEMKAKDKDSWQKAEVEESYAEETPIYDESKFVERCKESDEEEEEEEKDVARRFAPTMATEKFEEEVAEVESDHVFAEIPAEILADREAMVNKLKELQLECPELRRKNKLLEIFVFKYIEKIKRVMTPSDPDATLEEINKMYKSTLRSCKLEVDEIMARRSQLLSEIESYKQRVQAAREEDERNFQEFLNYEKNIAVGLIYAKNGRKITEKLIKEILHRQTVHRETLSQHRLGYILCQHRFQKIEGQLKNLEVLGPGMTTMDYEALQMVYDSYKDKLDERDKELEKMRAKIEEMANTLAHFKEKKVCLMEDIEIERKLSNEHGENMRKIREEVNALHATLKMLRREHEEKSFEAGLLVAQPELREMERMKSQLNALKNDIELVKNEIQRYVRPNNNWRWTRSKAFTMSDMAKDPVKHTWLD